MYAKGHGQDTFFKKVLKKKFYLIEMSVISGF